jgi:hypothetical protein
MNKCIELKTSRYKKHEHIPKEIEKYLENVFINVDEIKPTEVYHRDEESQKALDLLKKSIKCNYVYFDLYNIYYREPLSCSCNAIIDIMGKEYEIGFINFFIVFTKKNEIEMEFRDIEFHATYDCYKEKRYRYKFNYEINYENKYKNNYWGKKYIYLELLRLMRNTNIMSEYTYIKVYTDDKCDEIEKVTQILKNNFLGTNYIGFEVSQFLYSKNILSAYNIY